MVCPQCGAEIKEGRASCAICGLPVAAEKSSARDSLLLATVMMIIVLIAILAIPMVAMNTGSEWLDEIARVTFTDVIDMIRDFSGNVFEGVIISMTMIPFLAAAISLIGTLLNKRKFCFIVCAIASGVLIYFLYCFVDEFGIESVLGEKAVISWGVWIALFGHVATCIFCRSKKQ